MSQLDNGSWSDTLQKLFQRSIDYYCRIDAVYLKIGNEPLDSMLNSTETSVQELSHLFSKVENIDRQIKSLMENTSISQTKETDSLIQLKKKVLERIYDRNRFLHGKAQNVKSLLQHELNTMNTGHNAMRGYRSLSSENKGILTESI